MYHVGFDQDTTRRMIVNECGNLVIDHVQCPLDIALPILALGDRYFCHGEDVP